MPLAVGSAPWQRRWHVARGGSQSWEATTTCAARQRTSSHCVASRRDVTSRQECGRCAHGARCMTGTNAAVLTRCFHAAARKQASSRTGAEPSPQYRARRGVAGARTRFSGCGVKGECVKGKIDYSCEAPRSFCQYSPSPRSSPFNIHHSRSPNTSLHPYTIEDDEADVTSVNRTCWRSCCTGFSC